MPRMPANPQEECSSDGLLIIESRIDNKGRTRSERKKNTLAKRDFKVPSIAVPNAPCKQKQPIKIKLSAQSASSDNDGPAIDSDAENLHSGNDLVVLSQAIPPARTTRKKRRSSEATTGESEAAADSGEAQTVSSPGQNKWTKRSSAKRLKSAAPSDGECNGQKGIDSINADALSGEENNGTEAALVLENAGQPIKNEESVQQAENKMQEIAEQSADSGAVEARPLCSLASEGGNEAPAYTIIFKKGSYEKEFVLNADDCFDIVYRSLFGDDLDRKLVCLENRLSRHLSVAENGLFPGVNYVTLPESDDRGLSSVVDITVQLGGDERLVLSLSRGQTVADLLGQVEAAKGVSTAGMQASFNGLLLRQEREIGSALESNDVIDVVCVNQIKMLSE